MSWYLSTPRFGAWQAEASPLFWETAIMWQCGGSVAHDVVVHIDQDRLDRPRLEARVCECYAVVKQEYDRLLPPTVLESA